DQALLGELDQHEFLAAAAARPQELITRLGAQPDPAPPLLEADGGAAGAAGPRGRVRCGRPRCLSARLRWWGAAGDCSSRDRASPATARGCSDASSPMGCGP